MTPRAAPLCIAIFAHATVDPQVVHQRGARRADAWPLKGSTPQRSATPHLRACDARAIHRRHKRHTHTHTHTHARAHALTHTSAHTRTHSHRCTHARAPTHTRSHSHGRTH